MSRPGSEFIDDLLVIRSPANVFEVVGCDNEAREEREEEEEGRAERREK